ncbi:MAG: SulP family inorganic anion transporter [Gammaproteobacteria bacterium]|nr:SulP family inorganic anion transporter [Gammaproteobacteria bacterium]
MYKHPTKGDVWGGVSASAVMLPQATAFGIALWAPYTQNPATGAMAGLITAIALCFFSGLSRGTSGMVSSPTGPTMVLVAGALASLYSRGFSTSELFLNIAIMLFLSGFIQILIGLFNGGRLIKFIPYPVVAGFMTGSALLMINSQVVMLDLLTLSPQTLNNILQQALWIPWLTALLTFLAISILPKILPVIPGTVSGLISGTLIFHLLNKFNSSSYSTEWVVGRLPDISSIQLINLSSFEHVPWLLILPISFALAVLSSLDSLLTSVVADVATTSRHNAKRELTGQGAGQMVAALFGGIAGAGTTGASIVAIKSGGRHWVAFFSALTFVLIIILLGPIAALLPISVLAGIILHVAIMGMLERDILLWLRNPRNRMDAMTAILVTGVTVTYDLMIAVGIGLILATFQFVRAQILSPVVHRRSTIAQHPSLRRRNEEHRNLLKEHADNILIYELKGNLFFGTVDKLFEEFNSDLHHPVQIILDMARVQQVDLTAVKMLQQMADRLHKVNGELIFTNVRKGKGLNKKVAKTLRQISPHHSGNYPVHTFIDADEAIEYAENKLLESLGAEPGASTKIELKDSELCHGFDETTLKTLQKNMKSVTLKSGDRLFKAGDIATELFVVLEGEIDILLPYDKKRYKRLAKFGPGAFFGEIVFLKSGARTADAKAIIDTELLMLDENGFEQLKTHNPQAAIMLVLRLGRELSERLRWTDTELRRLSD